MRVQFVFIWLLLLWPPLQSVAVSLVVLPRPNVHRLRQERESPHRMLVIVPEIQTTQGLAH